MDQFFNARSVAVVGVSESPDNLARRIVGNLHEFNFGGIIYQVGQKGGTAFGRRIHRSVSDIPDQVDLAVILVPARFVPSILEECGQKGIRRAVIESAGFGEFGPEGMSLQQQLLEVTHRYNIRFIGPNGIGSANMQNGLVVAFTSLPDIFRRGKVSIISQSGGVGLSYLNLLASENIGIAKFASIGNKLDVDECDLLEYLINDPQTDIIVMYLEGIANGKRLMDIARRTAKPILMHKSNIGALAREIAASHTASLSGDDAVVSAALEQVGIARFEDADTLVNYLKILPLPRLKGNRLAIVSRSGGHAVMAADACETSGFTFAKFPEQFLREIEKHFRASVIRLTNPLDLGDLFDFDVYVRIIQETLKLPDVDGVVFLHTYIAGIDGGKSRELFTRIEELSFQAGKPVATFVATDHEELAALRRSLPHPVFTAPEDAIRALALVRDFRHETPPAPAMELSTLDQPAIRAVLDRAKAERRPVHLDEGLVILKAAGLPVPEHRVASGVEEAVAAAAALRCPVTLKLIASGASHKTDLGGVQLNLEGADNVRRGYADLRQAAGRIQVPEPLRVLVQPMVERGRELILGARQDPNFGGVVLVGLGGIFVEVFKDVVMRVVPFSAGEAEQMIRRLRAYPILAGARGQQRRDLDSIRDGLLAVARLVTAFPEIRELDINPLMVQGEGRGAWAVDARIVCQDEH